MDAVSNTSFRGNGTEGDFKGGYGLGETIAISVTIIAIIVMTILGNLLVCTAVFMERSLRRVQNWFIASLAVSDLSVGLVIMPPALVKELMGYWYFGRVMCEVFLALDVFACTASILNLCMISVDRYWSVTQAVQYFKNTNSKRAGCMIAAAWVLSAVISLPPLVGWKTKSPSGDEEYPQCEYSDSPGYVLYSTMGSFYIPLAVVVFMNVRIFSLALKRVKKHPSSRPVATRHKPEAVSVNIAPIALKSILKKSNAKPKKDTPKMTESPIGVDSNKPCIKVTSDQEDQQCASEEQANGNVGCENGLVVPDGGSATRRTRRVKVGPVFVEEITCHEAGSCPPRVESDIGTGVPSEFDPTSVGLDTADGPGDFTSRPDQIRRKLRQSRERRLTVVIGIVMGVFVICWVPFFVSYVVVTVCSTCSLDPVPFSVFVWLGYCNSALNPAIYTVFNRDFRKAFRKVIFGRILRQSKCEQSSFV
ncbi:probable G-protein coupled receptor No18 [Branchiostoma floridae]|uniref:Probable G-protein coupled receptor No18 n=1 Tax=Branchiostoma floridae TaxID=7739 RepID=A0A9J7M236_BRAFL|nr:probable G-protein coupled receptor No18 [Branchiostoma floridae]